MIYRKMKFVAAFIFAMAVLSFPARADSSTTFVEANAKYQAKDFKGAALLYEELISSGHSTAESYYDLGNAYFRANQKGKALIAYQRAFRAAPRDADVRWNISIVKSYVADRTDAAGGDPILTKLNEIFSYLSTNEISWALTGCLLLWVLLVSGGLFLRSAQSRLKGFQRLTIFLTVVSAFLFIVRWTQIKDPVAVVLDKEVFARYGPTENESKAFLLHEGAEAKITDRTDDWFYVSLSNGQSGWIPKRACEII